MSRLVGWRGWDSGETDRWEPIRSTADGKLMVDANVVIGDITIDEANGAINDGVDPDIKATVIESVDEAGVFGLVVLGPDGSTLSGGEGGGPSAAVTIADGDDENAGTTTDAKVLGDNTGTLSAKLRGINTIINDVWDSLNNRLKVVIQNTTIAVTQSGTWITTVTQATGTNLHTVVDSGTITVTGNVTVVQPTATNLKAEVIGTGTFAVQATVVGTVADDVVTPGAPVMVGGMAKSPDGTDPGNVSDENDTARFITDLNRRQFVNDNHPGSKHANLNGTSAYTDQALIADPGDGFQVVITNIIASNRAAEYLEFFLEEGSTKIFGPIMLENIKGRGFATGPIYLPCTASTAITLTSDDSHAQAFDVFYFVQKV